VGIDSTIIVQESQQRRPAHGWKGEHLLVILSEAKDDPGRTIRLSSPDEPMGQ